MPYPGPPSHTPQQWSNAPSTSTPLDKAHLESAETDLVTYTQAAINDLASYVDIASGSNFVPTAVKTSTYTTVANDFVPVDASGGAITINLPTAPPDKTRVAVKIIAQASPPNTVTVARGGSAVFNKTGGSTSLALAPLFQGVILQYKSSTSIWYVQSTDSPLNVASGAAKLGTDGTVGGPGGSGLTTSMVTDSSASPKTIDSTGVADTNVLAYNSASGKWKPAVAGGGGGASNIPVTTIAAASGSQVLTVPAGGQAYKVTLTGNWTPTITGAAAGTECIVDFSITSDLTGGRIITWPGSVTWLGGVPPPTAVFGQTQLVTVVSFDGGVTWLGSGPNLTVLSSVFTVKGDLLAASGANTPVRVGVGVDGQILSANSAQAPGVSWIDPPAAGPITPTSFALAASAAFTTVTNYASPGYMSFPNGMVALTGCVTPGVAVTNGDVIVAAGQLPSPVKNKMLPLLQNQPAGAITIGLALWLNGTCHYYGPGIAVGDNISFDSIWYSRLV